jgi:hypothetical protein
MNKLLLVLLSTSFALLTSVSSAQKGEKSGTVEILHKPDDQAIIIRINENALEAHIAHGDCVFDDNGGNEEENARPNSGLEIIYCEDVIDFPDEES